MTAKTAAGAALNPRLVAAQVICAVLKGKSLNTALSDTVKQRLSSRDRAFVQALCFGVLRWYFRLHAFLGLLLERPLRQRDEDLRVLIIIGLYQLHDQRAPDYAVVDESVNAAEQLGKLWAKKLVNAVLRNFIRRRDALSAELMDTQSAKYASPDWIIQRVAQDWPSHWESLLNANNTQAPMTLRVNTGVISREAYLEQLLNAGLQAQPVTGSATALQLQAPCDVAILPGFDQGLVSVQDAAAQYAAALLDPQPWDYVLDACAAPGGKSLHLLQHQPLLGELVALEIDSQRGKLIEQNLYRAGVDLNKVSLQAVDAADVDQWWSGKLFQRILLDAPCSASGVIRRHPDIKILKREADISALLDMQMTLLAALWPTLAPGGMLLYCTCSVFAAENTEPVARFLQHTQDARSVSLDLPVAEKSGDGYQVLTGVNDMDGFFYAGLQKTLC